MGEGVGIASSNGASVPARVPAVETYACIGCGGVVEEGRARLAAVTCHDCDGRVESERSHEASDAPVADSFSVDEELLRELYRSRRYERPLVVASIRRSALNGYRAVARTELEGRLRALDRVWEVGDHIVVLLPETDREGAELLVERLRDEVPGLVPEPYVGLAAFPADALTAKDLLAAATTGTPAVAGAADAADASSGMLRRLMHRTHEDHNGEEGSKAVTV